MAAVPLRPGPVAQQKILAMPHAVWALATPRGPVFRSQPWCNFARIKTHQETPRLCRRFGRNSWGVVARVGATVGYGQGGWGVPSLMVCGSRRFAAQGKGVSGRIKKAGAPKKNPCAKRYPPGHL